MRLSPPDSLNIKTFFFNFEFPGGGSTRWHLPSYSDGKEEDSVHVIFTPFDFIIFDIICYM